MTDKELNNIGEWLNTKGYDLDLTDCFWMEDWIGNETKIRDIAELLQEYHNEQLATLNVLPKSTICEDCKKNKYHTITLCKKCYLNGVAE